MSDDVHTLSGAYVMDALDAAEAARFEAHLADCAACRQETRELREAAAAIGGHLWSVPPPRLRESVLAMAERTPQQPPPRRAEPVPSPGGSTSVRPLEPRRRRPMLLLAAAAAVVAVLAGGLVGLRTIGADRDPELVAAAEAVFDAPDSAQTAVTTANGGTLRVAVSRTREEMAVDTRDLPDLDREHVYQLWTVESGLMRSRAILGGETSGAAMAVPTEGTEVAVTVEPAGGSEQPTTEPIVTVDPTDI